MSDELNADELALYDRQLRVWGAAGQARIKKAAVLVINLNGVGTEIVKNLVLSGIGSMELWDPSTVTEEDLSAQFFLSEEDVGKKKLEAVEPRVKDMNPRVNLTINTSPFAFDESRKDYLKKFHLIIANNLTGKQLHQLNELTRELEITLHVSVAHGLYGMMFNDLIVDVSKYTMTKRPMARKVGPLTPNTEILSVSKSLDKENNQVMEHFTLKTTHKKFEDAIHSKNLSTLTRKHKKRVSPLLSIFAALYELEKEESDLTPETLKTRANEIQERLGLGPIADESYFTAVLEQLHAEIAPVAAVLGGALAQDVINFLSKKDTPINNLLLLDGDKFLMPIYEL